MKKEHDGSYEKDPWAKNRPEDHEQDPLYPQHSNTRHGHASLCLLSEVC